jgi:hypothetical protein
VLAATIAVINVNNEVFPNTRIKPNSASTPTASHEDDLVRDLTRQEANLTLAQDSLTTTQDTVAPEVVSVSGQRDTFHWSQPSFDQVISRWYQVSTPSWPYTATADGAITTLDISKALFNIQTLFDRIKRFRYWRAGVKIRIQVNSTQFHYGSLIAAIVPHYNATESAAATVPNTVFSLSGQKCSGILSANTGKPLELSCPFQSPSEYLPITQATETQPFFLQVCVMNPLKLAGGGANPTLAMSIFAQFVDFNLLAPSEITANSTSKKIVPADKEQQNAVKQGTLGKVAGAVSDIAGKLTVFPVIGSIAAAVAPISKGLGMIFDYFGWDKPTNISSQVYTISRQGRGYAHSSGQDPAEPVGLKPDQKVSTLSNHFGTDDPATKTLLALIQTPLLSGRFTIANNQAVSNVFKSLYVRPYAPIISGVSPTSTQQHDYLSFYSSFFNSCRGSIRYIIHFDTSSYTTARLRITLEPSAQAVAAITDGGDSFSRIVDINGCTTIALEVPYCYPAARMPIGYALDATVPSYGTLLFSLITPIQTNGSSADVIFVNIFRCAGEDFKFYQPHNFRITANSLTELVTGPVPTLGDGPKVVFDRITEDEEIVAHNDFLHRYHYVQPTSAYLTPLFPTATITAVGRNAGDPYYWLLPFRAYRGAVRILTYEAQSSHGLSLNNHTNPLDTVSYGCYLTPSLTTDTPVEIPYNNNVRFLPMRYVETIYTDAYARQYSTSAPVRSVLWASGDDFTLGLRCSPPLIPA